jgi:tetratricopeptide (TPR) repeat protein
MANKAPVFRSTSARINQSASSKKANPRALIIDAQRSLLRGDVQKARSAAETAVKLAPDDPGSFLALATVCQVAGDAKRAEANYLQVLRRQPKHFKAMLGLGQLKLNSGEAPVAIAVLQAALQLEPANADARHLLARAFGKNNQTDKAVEIFKALIAENSQDPGVWAGYGRSLAVQGAVEEAIQAYKRAAQLKPGDEAVEEGLAAAYLSIGQIDQAEIHNRNALRIKPSRGLYRSRLASLKRLREDELADAEKQLSLLPPNDRKRLPLLTTIATVAERAGDHETCFKATMEALSLIDARLPTKYDAAAAVFRTDGVINRIGVKAHEYSFAVATRPIFIVGMPRSGSTLTEQILACHPAVFPAGEWRAMLKVRQQMSDIGKAYPDQLDDLTADELGELRATYFASIPDGEKGKSHVTDKTLGNVFHLPFFERSFPEAVIVRTRRHPLDSLWSILRLAFGSNIPFGSRIENVCNEVIQQQRVFAAFTERGTLPLLDVFYEELVERFEEGARSLVSFAGLPWNDACLQPQESRRAVFTASAGQVHDAISKTSIGRWKPFAPYLTHAIDTLKPFIELHEAELAKRGISYT